MYYYHLTVAEARAELQAENAAAAWRAAEAEAAAQAEREFIERQRRAPHAIRSAKPASKAVR